MADTSISAYVVTDYYGR